MTNKLRVCRVCLEPEGKVKLAPIFAHSDKNKIALKILILSGIQVVTLIVNRRLWNVNIFLIIISIVDR